MTKEKVLFVCIHNSARSQMAEAFLNQLGGDRYIAESAGLEPGVLNPIVVESMKEVGIDLSGNRTKDVFELFRTGKLFSLVITVCDETNAERCPVFPGISKKLHWSFQDPSQFIGTPNEKLQQTNKVRDAIKAKIEAFLQS